MISFNNFSFIVPVLIFIGFFSFFYLRYRTRFFSWVEDHWFFKQSIASRISTYLYLVGFTLLALALLDLRGPEKRIKGAKQDTKTVILVDSSASMLAEDVRPNRFKKALLLVKHYVKKAVGQQISLVVFSDNQKRIVPFTEDIDLIYARIERLKSLNLGRGGTGLSQAIAESVEYFKSSGGELSGNILIFTDAEETELSFPMDIPDGITVGMIGVGTAKGAPIPQRDSRGEFIGNKKHKGDVVISKLNEKMLKDLSNKIKNYRYWVATSYSLPTEEILGFFNRIDKIKNDGSEYRVKPVLAHLLLVPGVILLFLAFLFNYKKPFVISILIVSVLNSNAQENSSENKEPVKSEFTLRLEERLARNELGVSGRKKLAESLLKDGFPDMSEKLYEETLSGEINPGEIKDYSNYALAKIQNGKKEEGLEDSKRLLEYLENKDLDNKAKLERSLEKNILKAIEESGGGGKGKSQEQNSENKDNDDQKESKDNESGEGDQKDQNEDKQDQKDKSENQKNNDQEEKNEQSKSDQKEGEDKDVPKKKLPAILKQLISDDNKLQKKIIDAKTTERKTKEQKDW